MNILSFRQTDRNIDNKTDPLPLITYHKKIYLKMQIYERQTDVQIHNLI